MNSEPLNYYNIGFQYRGVKGMGASDEERQEDRDLSKAERYVEDTLKFHAFDYRHSYSWPDGSLYKYIRTPLSLRDITAAVANVIDNDFVRVSGVSLVDPKMDPYKCCYKTLEDYFDGKQEEAVGKNT